MILKSFVVQLPKVVLFCTSLSIFTTLIFDSYVNFPDILTSGLTIKTAKSGSSRQLFSAMFKSLQNEELRLKSYLVLLLQYAPYYSFLLNLFPGSAR